MLVDNTCKYELDLASIVEDKERKWFGLQTNRRTDKVKPQYAPQLNWWGYDYSAMLLLHYFTDIII